MALGVSERPEGWGREQSALGRVELFGILSLFKTVQGRVTEAGKGEVWIKANAQSKEFCKGMEQRTEHTRDPEGSEAAGSGKRTLVLTR